MLQNASVTAFTASEVLRKKQQGGGCKILSHPPRLWLKLFLPFLVIHKTTDHKCLKHLHFSEMLLAALILFHLVSLN